jgi:hypothetical protein
MIAIKAYSKIFSRENFKWQVRGVKFGPPFTARIMAAMVSSARLCSRWAEKYASISFFAAIQRTFGSLQHRFDGFLAHVIGLMQSAIDCGD